MELARKRLEKLSGSQYSILRDLTDQGPLDAASLENAVADIVKDRLGMAQGFIHAARLLMKSPDPMVRRSAVSRAYYGAYQAARAAYFSVARSDQDDHEKLGKEINGLPALPGALGDRLKELRQLRNEFDYSPYPGPKPGTPYNPKEIEGIIRASVRTAESLLRAFKKYLRTRK